MKTKFLSFVLTAGFGACALAEPLTRSTFTDIIKNVNVVAAADKSAAPAALNKIVQAPDLVRTGPESRAEMTAPDQTITRVGANTVFSFEPDSREMRLEKGSVLFHAPKGKGGGVIKSGGASAAVTGTTVICVKGADGTFKTILLEGSVKVTLANGKSVTLHDGQVVIVSADGESFSDVMDIDLAALVAGSSLVSGFSHDLPSLPLIRLAILNQQRGNGGGNTNQLPVGVTLDQNAQTTLVPPKFPTAPPTGRVELNNAAVVVVVPPPATPPPPSPFPGKP